jgi:hypothetical protein
MTREERKAYSRGYYAGRNRRWPAYAPPAPPDLIMKDIVRISQELADHVAMWCGAFGDDDEFTKEMRPLCEAVDAAQSKVTDWLQDSSGDTNGS